MMGSEVSQLKGLEIDENAVETTDFWSLYQATIKDSCRYFSLKSDGSVSVFKGKAATGPLWTVSSPLEKFSNNILKYRHPCIIRYISSWQQRSVLHLATEFVVPLSHTITSHTPLQKCIGLNNILRALVFLHDQAVMSHNNVSISAIYVTGDGQWKLGGLQYLCSYNDLTVTYLRHARIHRYDKAVDPNEDSHEVATKVDQYGFAVLVDDVFKGCEDGPQKCLALPAFHAFTGCDNVSSFYNIGKTLRALEKYPEAVLAFIQLGAGDVEGAKPFLENFVQVMYGS